MLHKLMLSRRRASSYGCVPLNNRVRTVLVTYYNFTWQLSAYSAIIIRGGHVAIAVKLHELISCTFCETLQKRRFAENLHNYAPS